MSFFSSCTFAKIPRTLIVAALLLAARQVTAAASRTTGIGFQGLQSTVAIGLGIPHATVIDAAGNLYVTDLIDSKVLRIERGASSANCTLAGSCTPVGSGFIQPVAIALDTAGSLYVADASLQTLFKVTPAGVQTVVATGLSGVSGVALGADGTAYVAVTGRIVQVSPAGVSTTFANASSQPGGIAIGVNGTIYLADLGGGKVFEYSPAGASTILVSGLSTPQSVALDGAGNLYISDSSSNSVSSVPTTGNGYSCPSGCNPLALQLNSPSGIASDASGNVYVADTGNQRLVKLTQDADFGIFPVVASNGSPASSLTFNYLLYSSSCASPPIVSVLTRGAANRDFTSSATASVCTPGTPDSLAITVNFAPLSPGLRTGSVQFVDSTGVPQVGTYLHGVGKGPLITWNPGVVTAAINSGP